MPLKPCEEKRARIRTLVSQVIDVSSGNPNRSGILYDISSSGAAINYHSGTCSNEPSPRIGEKLEITVGGVTVLPARVARTFEGGYAVRFDWTMDIYRAFV